MNSHSSSCTTDLDQLDIQECIIIKGARVNNLKNLSVAIPRNKLVVITGLSGSGKSSLAFDTLFAEGQRMYMESLSAYARQFLGKMEKPAVEYIRGVAPAIAIEQKNHTKHPRSTVGTSTEIYDYLKLLYARVGVTYSPVSGQQVTKDCVSDVVDYIQQHEEGTKVMILAPIKVSQNRSLVDALKVELGKGFTRVMQGVMLLSIEELVADQAKLNTQESLYLLIDRIVVSKSNEDNQFRIADSVQTAFFEGEGMCLIEVLGKEQRTFSNRFERDGITFEVPSFNFFSFNNPYGACRTCEGFGRVLGIDEDKVIPNKSLTVYEGAIVPWKSEIMKKWLDPLVEQSRGFDFPIHTPYSALSDEQRRLLWTGNEYFKGLNTFFDHLASQAHKIQYRVLLSRYRGKKECPDCQGTRIRKDASYVKVNGRSIAELLLMSVAQLVQFFGKLTLNIHQQLVAERLLTEIKDRLSYLEKVGLSYLTLNRQVATLSGGEHQRIKLATALGSTLVGTMYIMDEPTIGLHPRDTRRLTDVLIALKQLGNSVIVVEHEEMVMRAADQIIDIGPEAGSRGGELVFQGDWHTLKSFHQSHTARYLNGLDKIPVPPQRRTWHDALCFQGACEHNLKHIDVTIPLGVLTVITGVSGSGKTTLVKEIIYPAIRQLLGLSTEKPGKFDGLTGDFQKLDHIDFIDQHPIGKSSRSNPSTYIKAYDAIRQLFAAQPLSQQRGYQPGQFSFNIEGGRCEACQGEGEIKIEMQFMADIFLTCEHCHGKRFKQEILEVRYQNTDISEVLDMTVEDSLIFFKDQPLILNKLYPLQEVGLGYVRLGQSSNSLSGGEAQRVKLAAYLGKGQHHRHTLFIFDEPTTGLHVHDIHKLLKAINALIRDGNSVLVIEHNMEMVKCADWLIDLGPEGGEQGGEMVFKGTPEEMIKLTDNHTAQYLREKLG
ncbi:MAG: excinuclease ABC subunit UvrA [Amoebophilaceae bacterium]|jgi:excinuclease ABC subunit A|nr:excinuclease ABC subunit UvrA [Amoebophilaceae bacterium]